MTPRAHGDLSEMLPDVRRTVRTIPLWDLPLSFTRNRSCAADYDARGRGSVFQTRRGYTGWNSPRPDERREASALSRCVLRRRKCSGCVGRHQIGFGQLRVGFGWSRGLNCTKSRERNWVYRSIPVASARGTLQRLPPCAGTLRASHEVPLHPADGRPEAIQTTCQIQ